MQKILNSSKNICAAGTGTWAGWSSDTWGSYLVVVSPAGDKLYENFYGTKVENDDDDDCNDDDDDDDLGR